MKYWKVLFGLGLCICEGVFPANADRFYFPATGHWYEPVLVPGGIQWPEANAAAMARGGYLCTVTNSAENEFVASLVNSSYYSDFSINNDILGPWLGGFRHANESQWRWVTGETFTFTNWRSGQPDGYGGSEQRLQYYAGAAPGPTWGDHPGTPIPGYSLPRGYVVEYERPHVSIARTNHVTMISWPSKTDGWVLETTPSLSDPQWRTITTVPFQTNASGFFISVTNPVGNAFFRLRFN